MLNNKIAEAKKIIEEALSVSKKPFVAFSGGKDGLVVAHLVSKICPNIKMICEVSHTFDIVIMDIKNTARKYNFNVDYIDSLSDEWLVKNSKFLFASETKLISSYCSQRQQRTLKRFQKEGGYDCTFTGRTKWDNTVKAPIYKTKHGLQAHPIRDFKEEDVWDYLSLNNIDVPLIYKSKFGERTGNAPFYAMGYKNKGCEISKCWEAVNELDPEKKFYSKFAQYITKSHA